MIFLIKHLILVINQIYVSYIEFKVKKAVHLPIPAVRALRKLGMDINHARRRRRIPIKLMAERANVSRATIGKIERGDSTTSIGGYAAVLFSLGMINRLYDLVDVSQDLVGLELEDERLPKRVRLPSRYKSEREEDE